MRKDSTKLQFIVAVAFTNEMSFLFAVSRVLLVVVTVAILSSRVFTDAHLEMSMVFRLFLSLVRWAEDITLAIQSSLILVCSKKKERNSNDIRTSER